MAKKKLSADRFGEKLRAYRTEAGLRVEDVARLAEMNPNYLSRVERGEVANPSWATVVALCVALGRTPDDFAVE